LELELKFNKDMNNNDNQLFYVWLDGSFSVMYLIILIFDITYDRDFLTIGWLGLFLIFSIRCILRIQEINNGNGKW
jgi:hypothetical protein